MNLRSGAKQAKSASPRRLRTLKTYAVTITLALLMISGFFFAGRQHFSSMDYSMKNSRLRKQIDDLQAEKRRLLLSREVALSPAEIKKAAKKVGLLDNPVVAETPAPQLASLAAKASPAKVPELKPMILKTASVTPSATRIAAVYQKPDRPEKLIKRALAAE